MLALYLMALAVHACPTDEQVLASRDFSRAYGDQLECLKREKEAQSASDRQERTDEFVRREQALQDVMEKAPVARMVLSTLLCSESLYESDALKLIREEREASKIAGVVNLGRLGELQDGVVTSRKAQASYREQLKQRRLSARPCTDPEVRELLPCILGDDDSYCTENAHRVAREAAKRWNVRNQDE